MIKKMCISFVGKLKNAYSGNNINKEKSIAGGIGDKIRMFIYLTHEQELTSLHVH